MPIYKLIRYHRLTFNSIADDALRSTYLPWIESITHVKTGEDEELELRLNSNYEKIWLVLKQRLDKPAVRLKSQYSSRLYQWAKQYVAVGYKEGQHVHQFRRRLPEPDLYRLDSGWHCSGKRRIIAGPFKARRDVGCSTFEDPKSLHSSQILTQFNAMRRRAGLTHWGADSAA